MTIRRAMQHDIRGINRLLHQVEDVHQKGRPDLFKPKSHEIVTINRRMTLMTISKALYYTQQI